jgi:hypothetical protein
MIVQRVGLCITPVAAALQHSGQKPGPYKGKSRRPVLLRRRPISARFFRVDLLRPGLPGLRFNRIADDYAALVVLRHS